MKYLLFIIPVFFINIRVVGQKPALDTSALGTWPTVIKPLISNDGKYASYIIERHSSGSYQLVVKGTDNGWEAVIVGPTNGFFSSDSKRFIYQSHDTLYFLTLGEELHFLSTIRSYRFPSSANQEWFAYQLEDSNKDVILLNLVTGKERRFRSVEDYTFNDTGNVFLARIESLKGEKQSTGLLWLNLQDTVQKTIYSSEAQVKNRCSVSDYSFDRSGHRLIFTITEEKDGRRTHSIWYYCAGQEKAVLRFNDQSPEIDSGYTITGAPKFSYSGQWIFFNMQPTSEMPKTGTGYAGVNIWNYKDKVLLPEQKRQLSEGQPLYAAVVSVEDGRAVRLEQTDEEMVTSPERVTGDWVVISDHITAEVWLRGSQQRSYYLVSLKTGERILLKKNEYSLRNFSFSPNCKYLVYYDLYRGHYFTYDIKSRVTRNMTADLPHPVSMEYPPGIFPHWVADVVGWMGEDSALMLYDNYDLWSISLTETKIKTCITKGYGYRHHIKFRLAFGMEDDPLMTFKGNESLLLTAFSDSNKYNGFYSVKLTGRKAPECLSMGSYLMYRTESQRPLLNSFSDGMVPLKAANSNSWIVSKESAKEARNFYFTRDFKSFVPLSSLHPQTGYNWLTTELLTWRQLDGSRSQGALYKPENFDPSKKYPVIINYYDKLSQRLYEFPMPFFTKANINIPWFVSNGYLVFTPDIYYVPASRSNKTSGEWAYNSIVSAAKYLSTLPYVNARKIGIQGHSFGGGETNFLVTHTHIFAAAAEAAGDSDPISGYLTLLSRSFPLESLPKMSQHEDGQGMLGATPWERPDLYRRQSAVLHADHVTTPLLIMHNEKDNQIQWRQGIEMYMALYRLGKKVWMLQYDNGTHIVLGKDAIDYTIRLTQFFDYYLKDAPPPKWMTQGVPASMKGIDNGYELDTSGGQP
jgi:dipeptidyl aminopeptidase/acylaminoacyl peptidase